MLRYAAATDVGKKREQNEDNFLVCPGEGLFVVADGVGGRACGEVASALSVETFRAAATELHQRVAAFAADHTPALRNAVLACMDEVCQVATRRVYESAETEGKRGMTTTLVSVLVGGGYAFVAHVGDSRCYLLRGGEIRQVTEDHSMVNELVRTGKMTYAEAKASRHRHVITRAIGLYPTVQPSLAAIELLAGDRLLLCSDGLSDVVTSDDMRETAAIEDLDYSVGELIAIALHNGGPDNVTVVLLDPEGTERADEAIARARVLERLFLFEDMPYAARLQVARILEEVYFEPGDVLVERDSSGRNMFVVVEGEVEVVFGDVKLARLGPGEHFGELSLVDRLPRSASVIAATSGNAISIRGDALEEFCVREPELGVPLVWKLLRVLGQRLRTTNAKLGADGEPLT